MSAFYDQQENQAELGQKESAYLPRIQQPNSNNATQTATNGLDVGQKRTVPWLEEERETKTQKTNDKQGNSFNNILLIL